MDIKKEKASTPDASHKPKPLNKYKENQLNNKTLNGFIDHDLIEKVRAGVDIVEIVQSYGISLKKTGANYKAPCPFHKEKTPSFVVSPGKQIFTCFGCGKSGNAISFVMEQERISFPDAVKKLAAKTGIIIGDKEMSETEREERFKQEEMFIAMSKANSFFLSTENIDGEALKYINNRWGREAGNMFNIGMAPGDNGLLKYINVSGLNKETFIKLGLIVSNEGSKEYDFFRNRIIFPIYNQYGRVVGFTGRDHTGKAKTKYINLPESAIYQKRKTLYGIHTAAQSIRTTDSVYLVEGQPDVIRLQSLEINNTIATGGTALTDEQISLIERYTKNVVIIPDTDEAGLKALEKNGSMLIERGFNVNVILLPIINDEYGERIKIDPDSYFQNQEQFIKYETENKLSFILYLAKKEFESAGNDIDKKDIAANKIMQLVAKRNVSQHEEYIKELTSFYNKKGLKEILYKHLGTKKHVVADSNNKTNLSFLNNITIPEELTGIYNGYKMIDGVIYEITKSKDEHEYNLPISNFSMTFVFHLIDDSNDSKRLVLIQKQNGERHLIIVKSSELKPEQFKTILTSKGVMFFASVNHFSQICAALMELENNAIPIDSLGYYKEHGIHAFADGIINSNNQYLPCNELGIVQDLDKSYFLPAFSIINLKNDAFNILRKYKFRPGNLDFQKWSDLFFKAYGLNGAVGIQFFIISLFRDYIFDVLRFFPFLFLFGAFGTGKTSFVQFMLQIHGDNTEGSPINNSSIPHLSRIVNQYINGITNLKEYDNKVYENIQDFILCAYDGSGRGIAQATTDNKTKSFSVHSSIILDGNELPVKKAAVFSRMILLIFENNSFSKKQEDAYDELKKESVFGFSSILMELINYRKMFEEKFKSQFDYATDIIKNSPEIKKESFAERTIKHIALLCTPYLILKDVLKFPYSFEDLKQWLISLSIEQNDVLNEIKEITIFWQAFEHCLQSGMLLIGTHYLFEPGISAGDLYISFNHVLTPYNEYCRKNNIAATDRSSLRALLTSNENKSFVPGSQGRLGKTIIKAGLGSCYHFKLERISGGGKHEYKINDTIIKIKPFIPENDEEDKKDK